MMREFVHRDAFADQRYHVASPRGLLFNVGDVDRHQVHRNPTRDRATLAADHDLSPPGAIVAAAGAEITVRVTGGDDGQFGRTPAGPGPPVAHRFALFDMADVQDARLQIDDLLHGIV